jgi:hypothetical protein
MDAPLKIAMEFFNCKKDEVLRLSDEVLKDVVVAVQKEDFMKLHHLGYAIERGAK